MPTIEGLQRNGLAKKPGRPTRQECDKRTQNEERCRIEERDDAHAACRAGNDIRRQRRPGAAPIGSLTACLRGRDATPGTNGIRLFGQSGRPLDGTLLQCGTSPHHTRITRRAIADIVILKERR